MSSLEGRGRRGHAVLSAPAPQAGPAPRVAPFFGSRMVAVARRLPRCGTRRTAATGAPPARSGGKTGQGARRGPALERGLLRRRGRGCMPSTPWEPPSVSRTAVPPRMSGGSVTWSRVHGRRASGRCAPDGAGPVPHEPCGAGRRAQLGPRGAARRFPGAARTRGPNAVVLSGSALGSPRASRRAKLGKRRTATTWSRTAEPGSGGARPALSGAPGRPHRTIEATGIDDPRKCPKSQN